ncbi:MAG: hypothetical protein ACRCYU_13870, partial [Nocardioides sp.]
MITEIGAQRARPPARPKHNALEGVRPRMHTGGVEVYRSRQFKRWVDDLVVKAKDGDLVAVQMAKHVLDELNYIK